MAGSAPKAEVQQACAEAARAFEAWPRESPERRAAVMEGLAGSLESRREEIVQTAAAETALTIEELTPEFARMTGTLRTFAGVVREGSWVRAAIDRRSPSALGPNHDVRRMLVPLGPVAVFGSSNFPLAYGVCGGDTASALAAGCPVVVKEHPAHPSTGRLLASIAGAAIERAGFTQRLLGYVENEDAQDFGAAKELVQHRHIAAVGFTGSIPGGLAIERLGRERAAPVPVFAEMGSNNIAVITERAAAARGEHMADELAASIVQRFGQQCTRPGTIIVEPGGAGDRLVELLGRRIEACPGRDMLAPWIKTAYERRLERLEGASIVRLVARGSAGQGARGSFACLLRAEVPSADARAALDRATIRDEVFGPAAVVLRVSAEQVRSLGLRASLTLSVYAENDEHDRVNELVGLGRALSGRVIFNGVPTGVRVAHGMVHGGPYPATNRPETTAVGPYAMERWCRPVCWQNCPDGLLPEELRDGNPRGIWRVVNGEQSRSATC